MDNKFKELTIFEKMQITDEYLEETGCVMISKEIMKDIYHDKFDLIKFRQATFLQRLHYLFTGRLD